MKPVRRHRLPALPIPCERLFVRVEKHNETDGGPYKRYFTAWRFLHRVCQFHRASCYGVTRSCYALLPRSFSGIRAISHADIFLLPSFIFLAFIFLSYVCFSPLILFPSFSREIFDLTGCNDFITVVVVYAVIT